MTDHTPAQTGTVCPLCGVGCRLRPGAEESRARGVAGPANPNGRLCGSGVGAFDVTDERLTEPVVRDGGDRRVVSWGTAYDRVVERFEAVVDAHGPDALAFLGAPHCTNEENYLLQKLARTLGTNNVDNRARHCHSSTARALSQRLGYPATTNSLEDLSEADVIFVAGANPAERQPVAFNSFVRPAVDGGATLVHVDPVGNQTTRLADVHLAPRPDTDALVFDLLSATVLERGGVDEAFVDSRTRGYAEYAAALREFDPEHAAMVAGVDSEQIRRVGDAMASADCVAALVGTGVEGADGRANAPAALLNLLLLTGNVGRRGTGLYVLRGLVNEQGATDVGCVPDWLPGHQPVTDDEARARIAAEWGVDPPSTPGKSAFELLSSFGDGIRGALVVGENPAISKRDREWIRRRLDALDVLVVLDLAPNATTRHADVVLPAAAGVEKAGTVTNLERRIQRLRPGATPPGVAQPDATTLAAIGQRLFEDEDENPFEYTSVGEVFDELTRVAPTHAGLSFAEIGDGGQQWPSDDGVLYRETFATADGLAEFGTTQVIGEPSRSGGLELVTGGRTSEFYGNQRPDDRLLRIHPTDASERSIEPGDTVVVSTATAAVETTAALDANVRRGTVFLHASVADPLLRDDASFVTVEPIAAPMATDR